MLRADNLVVEFRSGRRVVHAVSGVSFDIHRGETLGLVGESGCGKSTVGRTLAQVQPATSGRVVYRGRDLGALSERELRSVRTKLQMIFQDPISSLNPRRRVKDIVAEPIRNFGLAKSADELDARVATLLEKVRLPRDAGGRWPHEFSGGQRQRIGIARALA
ncbi:MAG: ABC transporter ATP-binding protein, partial [Acidimicrobiales bacterium]|nr:ABC transporter ATP-binding protein [Acidimicrobiales bacterium]